MKITNVTARVIGVLGTDLMPDESMEITAKQAATPSIETVIKMGFLTVDNKAELEEAQEAKALEQEAKALEKARRQIMAELKAAGKLKEDAEDATEAPKPEETVQAPKRTRRPKTPEVPAE